MAAVIPGHGAGRDHGAGVGAGRTMALRLRRFETAQRRLFLRDAVVNVAPLMVCQLGGQQAIVTVDIGFVSADASG